VTIVSPASIKSTFTTGSKPNQANFEDLIDTTAPDWQIAITTLVQSGGTGILEIEASASATTRSVGVVGAQMLQAATTASVISFFGFGSMGSEILTAASTASAQDLIIPLTTQGDILYHDGAELQRLALGAAGTVLSSDGTDATWAAAGFSTGDAKVTFKNTADTGWVMMDDGTMGNAASGGTTRANADTEALFALLWNNISDTWAPVSSGRGASAAADFAANKTITLPATLGRALAVSGAGSGLTSRVLGEALGEEEHTLTTAEMPSHTHELTGTNTAGNSASISRATNNSQSWSSGTTGSDDPHNNMQPTSFLNVMIKL